MITITALAWMPLRVSVALVALLTVILLPWAVVTIRRSLALSAMTVAMLGMAWRGEAWKTVFLQSEQRVLELQSQLSPQISSTKESLNLARLFPDGVFHRPERAQNLARLLPVHLLSSRDGLIHGSRPGYMCDSGRLLQTPQAPHPYIAGSGNGSGESSVDLIRFGYNRNLAVYKDDLEFFAQVADQNDRSRARMFRFCMAQIRDGKPIPYVPESNGASK